MSYFSGAFDQMQQLISYCTDAFIPAMAFAFSVISWKITIKLKENQLLDVLDFFIPFGSS